MELQEYLNIHFPNLRLIPPIFYKWNIGIRFELENPNENFIKNFIDQVYSRSLAIFYDLFKNEDKVLLVFSINYYMKLNERKKNPNKIKRVIKKYMKKIDSFKLMDKQVDLQWEKEYYHFYNICNLKDIDIEALIKSCGNSDTNFYPSFYMPKRRDYCIDVYFINITKNTIFTIYDSQGCDLLSSSVDAIKPIYIKYNDWILDYDREKIDKIFK